MTDVGDRRRRQFSTCRAYARRNAGLRPQARAASNRRRRRLASVDGVPYGWIPEVTVGTPLLRRSRTPREGCPYKGIVGSAGEAASIAIPGEGIREALPDTPGGVSL